MPHRDPLLATRARCEQLRQRIAGFKGRAVARRDEPQSLAEAVAEAERLLLVLESLEAAIDVEPLEDDFTLATGSPADEAARKPESLEPSHDPPTLRNALVALALVPAFAVLAVLISTFREPPSHGAEATAPAAAAPLPAHLDTHVAVVVVSTTGVVNASPGDRCKVALHLAPEIECAIDVTCPGLERHFAAPACSLPADGAAVHASWPGVDFDGEVLSFASADGHGHITARLDPWRR
jgi:hypothetical protein